MEKRNVAGLKIDRLTKQELLKQILSRIKAGQKTFLTTPYSEFLYRGLCDNRVLDVLNKADFAVPDGIGIFWAAKYLSIPLTARSYWGKIVQAYWQAKYSLAAIIFNRKWIMSAFPEKMPGSELVWDIAKFAADNNLSIYLLGGFGETPNKVAENLKTSINHGRAFNKFLKITGWSNKNPRDLTAIDDIKKGAPDILLVAYGPIKQERWIADNFNNLPIKLAVGLGGTFDYIAGRKSEPPKWARSVGFEWLYRLFTQPRRIKRIWQATFGLAGKLVHYKVFMSFPLRNNAVAVILNQNNEIFVGRKPGTGVDIIKHMDAEKWKNYWQFPQGGIELTENLEIAIKREIKEETGMENLKFLGVSSQHHSYVWNNALRKFWHNRDYRFHGQSQTITYLKFLGNPDTIKLPKGEEFVEYKWVPIDQIINIVHAERLPLAKIAQADLKEMAEKGIL